MSAVLAPRPVEIDGIATFSTVLSSTTTITDRQSTPSTAQRWGCGCTPTFSVVEVISRPPYGVRATYSVRDLRAQQDSADSRGRCHRGRRSEEIKGRPRSTSLGVTGSGAAVTKYSGPDGGAPSTPTESRPKSFPDWTRSEERRVG